MITPPAVREEGSPADAVPLIRGGLRSLDPEKVRELCEDSLVDFGFYGLSVFAALDGDLLALCRGVPRLGSPGVIWVARCGVLRSRGFVLVATDASPHFDVVLPDLAASTIEALVDSFTSMSNPAKQR
jgi:hypothetical protein